MPKLNQAQREAIVAGANAAPTADAPCPHCGSLVWFPTARTVQSSAQPAAVDDFTLDDFRKQFELLRTLGSMRELTAPIPGMSEMISNKDDPEADVRRIQGIIDAMTKQERRDPDVIDISRCCRIAAGSATEPHEIEEFLDQFGRVRTLMRIGGDELISAAQDGGRAWAPGQINDWRAPARDWEKD